MVLIQSRIFDITASQVKNRSLETERNLTFVMHSYQFVVGRYCIMFIGPWTNHKKITWTAKTLISINFLITVTPCHSLCNTSPPSVFNHYWMNLNDLICWYNKPTGWWELRHCPGRHHWMIHVLVSILCHFFYFPTRHSHRTTVSFSGDNTLHGLRTKNISHPLTITLVYSSYFPSIIIVPSRSGLKSSITNRSVKTVPPKNLHFTVGFCP